MLEFAMLTLIETKTIEALKKSMEWIGKNYEN